MDSTSSELTLADLGIEPTIYLIPECETPEDVADCLRDDFDEIFENQLDGWYRVRETWPSNRSYELFCRWFDYKLPHGTTGFGLKGDVQAAAVNSFESLDTTTMVSLISER